MRDQGRGSAHPAPARNDVSQGLLWFGLLGGPAAWAVQTLVDLAVASHGCYPRLFPLEAPIQAGLRGIVMTVSLAALIVCIVAGLAAIRTWGQTRHEHQGGSGAGEKHGPATALLETGEGRTRFLAYAGLLTSILFIITVLAHTVSIFIVGPCAG
jgi:hypothetical protein